MKNKYIVIFVVAWLLTASIAHAAAKKTSIVGKVISVNGNSIELLPTKKGAVSIMVDMSSADFGPVLEQSDVTEKDHVIAVGILENGFMTAQKISDISKPLTLIRLGGKVTTTTEDGNFKIKTKSFGESVVRGNESTIYMVNGVLGTQFDITPGAYVKVSGRWNVTARPAVRKIEAKEIDVYSELNPTKITGKIVVLEKKDKYHSYFIAVEDENGNYYTIDMSDAATKSKKVKRKNYYIKEQLEVGDSVEVTGKMASDPNFVLADLVVSLANNANNK